MNSTTNLYDQCLIVYLMSTYENIQILSILLLEEKNKDELPGELLLFLSILLQNYNSLLLNTIIVVFQMFTASLLPIKCTKYVCESVLPSLLFLYFSNNLSHFLVDSLPSRRNSHT